jgi:hypothetical protein
MCGFGTLFHDSPDGVELKEAGCRSFGCDECGPKRRARQEIVARRGRPLKMITLTSNPAVGEGPEHRRQMMGLAWPKLRRLMQKVLKDPVEFYLAVEANKKGEPHFHILVRCGYIAQALLSKWWEELVGAPVVHIESLEGKKHIHRYIHKYVGKALHKFGTHKRYWMSRGWVLPPSDDEKVTERPPKVWGFKRYWIVNVAAMAAIAGYRRYTVQDEPGVIRMYWRRWETGPPVPMESVIEEWDEIFRATKRAWT